MMLVDGTGAELPSGGTAVGASSGNVANASAVAAIAAVASKTNYLAGFEVTGAGATAAAVVNATVTGCLGGTRTYPIAVPAGVTTGITPVIVNIVPPLPATAANTAITLTVPAFGAGNTNVAANIRGIQK
jgi:hypothetical protein